MTGPMEQANLSCYGLDMVNRIYSQDGQQPSVRTFQGGGTQTKITLGDNMTENVTIRKLTERECLRLQGFRDEEIDRLYAAVDENGKRRFSKSMMYKFAGNQVCVDCFVRITDAILDDMENPHADKSGLDYWMGEGS